MHIFPHNSIYGKSLATPTSILPYIFHTFKTLHQTTNSFIWSWFITTNHQNILPTKHASTPILASVYNLPFKLSHPFNLRHYFLITLSSGNYKPLANIFYCVLFRLEVELLSYYLLCPCRSPIIVFCLLVQFSSRYVEW